MNFQSQISNDENFQKRYTRNEKRFPNKIHKNSQ